MYLAFVAMFVALIHERKIVWMLGMKVKNNAHLINSFDNYLSNRYFEIPTGMDNQA